MKDHETLKRIIAAALVATLTFAPSLSAGQQKDGSNNKSPSESARQAGKQSQPARAEEKSPGGPHEGIKVHGHWAIAIKNPDGSVASRHEFENALVPSATALGDALGRATVIGRWNLTLVAAACVAQDGSGTAVVCDLEEPGGGNCPAASCQAFNNLTVSSANGKAILQGNATATFASSITTVVSFVSECPRSGTANYGLPTVCGSTPTSNASVFSSATIAPIAVSAGQIVQVTVTFSFS
jgi:hypothetical protein